ncbi:MAG: hypothetical protein ACE5KE_16210 [Methanosarcinales archaeon]
MEFSSASLNDESLTVTYCMLGDLNGNNILDTGDATLILRKVVGLD